MRATSPTAVSPALLPTASVVPVPRAVALVGATGSIGTQTLQVVAAHPQRLRIAALAAASGWEAVCATAVRTGAEAVALADPGAARQARARLAGTGVRVLEGSDGVDAVAAWPTADITLAAPTGIAGLRPVAAALRAGKDVALANKESLVAGGRLITLLAARYAGRLLPVDSEHSGLFQCLAGREGTGIGRMWLTASGGPFRTWSAERMRAATPEDALRHPTWRMGPRVTVDSATLFNKGLEVIEAGWLFGVPVDAVRVVVHPQSIVHALVEFVDGSFLAQCARPDMRLPIAYALSHPERWAQPDLPLLDPTRLGRLDFEPPDLERFPCLGLAYAAARAGGLAPAALNAADEVAVRRFLAGDIGFADIPRVLEDALDHQGGGDDGELAVVLEADERARMRAAQWRPARLWRARTGPAPSPSQGEAVT